jgi:flavin-dependent dehydrogenase
VLVCADGATSQLATKLGYCTEAPRGVCSRAFVAGGTHNAKFDGVCFYPKWSLPGYAALFRCAGGGVVVGTGCMLTADNWDGLGRGNQLDHV